MYLGVSVCVEYYRNRDRVEDEHDCARFVYVV